jgi:hypothetical protein
MQRYLFPCIAKFVKDCFDLDITLHQIRYRILAIDITARMEIIDHENPRIGPWEPSIDGPALRKAILKMACTSTAFINFVKERLLAGGHSSQTEEQRQLANLDDPRLLFIHAQFGMLSKRSNHNLLVTDATGPHYTMLVKLVAENLGSTDLTIDVNNPQEARDDDLYFLCLRTS